MKFYHRAQRGPADQSPPSRGAWIEIAKIVKTSEDGKVAPLAGGVMLVRRYTASFYATDLSSTARS